MRKLAPLVGRSPRTAKRFVNLYRVLKAREYVASALNPLLEAESLGGMTLLALVAGNPRGTRDLLDAIRDAPEQQMVWEFMRWESEAGSSGSQEQGDRDEPIDATLSQFNGMLPDSIGAALAETATHFLRNLRMQDLQRWLPTVRRFAFRSEIARDNSHSEAFAHAS